MFITTEDYKFRDLLQNKMAKDMAYNSSLLYRKYTSFNNQAPILKKYWRFFLKFSLHITIL